MKPSPFHIGEQQVQTRVGVREAVEPWARQVIRGFLPQQHREFYTQLPFIVAAARDQEGRPWVTLLTGPPGFVQSPDDSALVLSTTPFPGDALESSLTVGTELGMLGIELETRRRNRVNGTITGLEAGRLHLSVGQTFGNCPQYITERHWRRVDNDVAESSVSQHERLNDSMRDWIRSADTMFIASGYAGDSGDSESFGMDASHRGGAPGFVEVVNDRQLVFPDYAGNNHFNTLGNLVMDRRVGLLFVDFHSGSLMQITGEASIDWDSDNVSRYPGAQRLVCIDINAINLLENILPLRWSDPEGSVRTLEVTRKTMESDDVTSFEFVARDGGELPGFHAGQHLPVELRIEGHSEPVQRTYSLSNSPQQGSYRISVKRHPRGLASRLLHDNIQEGDMINAKPPAGDFVLNGGGRPVVLVSAGVGVTPMVSMLHRLGERSGDHPVIFIHGARDGGHHPLAQEVRDLAVKHAHIELDVSYSHPRKNDVPGYHYQRVGRVSGEVIKELIPSLDSDFYVCGPAGFMADVLDSLDQLGVPLERIHTETF